MLLLAAVGVAPVAAQRLGTAEVSVFGRATLMDPSVRSDPAAGIGGRVGVFVRPGWLLEVGGNHAAIQRRGGGVRRLGIREAQALRRTALFGVVKVIAVSRADNQFGGRRPIRVSDNRHHF